MHTLRVDPILEQRNLIVTQLYAALKCDAGDLALEYLDNAVIGIEKLIEMKRRGSK